MMSSRWNFGLAVITLGCLAGLLCGTLMYWSRQPQFPVYGYLFDGILAVVVVFGVVRLRKWKAAISDEFAVAKKQLATQIGFIAGFILYTAVNILPVIFRHGYDVMLAHLDGPREGFIMGQAAGMAPFVVGLMIGQVAAWWKYR